MKSSPGNSLQQIRAEFVRLPGDPEGGGSGSSEARPLGTYAESSTPPPTKSSRRAEARADRYELQGYARELLLARGRALGLEHAGNYHKSAKCLWTPYDREVHVHRSQEHGTAFYGGLVVCGKPGCPTCAAKVSERRRIEIAQAFDWAYQNGKKAVMVTFTHPHRSSQPLADQLRMQADAFVRLRRGEPWRRILPSGYMGLIRSLEVTHGANGWHPHTHEAWIVDKDADVSDLKRRITRRWLTMLQRAGMVVMPESPKARWRALRAFFKHSVDVMDNARSSDYMAKHDGGSRGLWGADRELAKASSKQGRRAGRTPFQLLADYRDGSEKAGRLYVEYVEAIRGKPPVYWSQGLKALVGVQDLTDEQVAERHDDKADLLGQLGLDDWRMVRRAGYRAHLLATAERDTEEGGWTSVQALLAELRGCQCSALPEPEHEPATAAERAERAAVEVVRQAPAVLEEQFAKVAWPEPAPPQDGEAERYRAALIEMAVRQRQPLPLVPGLRVDAQGRQVDRGGRPLPEWLKAGKRPRSAPEASCAGTGGDPAGELGSPDPAAPRGSERPSGRSRTAAAGLAGPSAPADAPPQPSDEPQPPAPAGSVQQRAAREACLQRRLYGPAPPD